jgi:hypothetical protein
MGRREIKTQASEIASESYPLSGHSLRQLALLLRLIYQKFERLDLEVAASANSHRYVGN